MEGARIIKLIDPVEPGGAVTFEEAFGEQSELRGRGRARRQARRMDRINKRRERKSAKQDARQERKNRRVEGRIARKARKGQGQRDEAMADAENEQAVEALNPQEDESTGYDQPQESGDSGEEQAPEELDQNSVSEEEESEFEAGSTSEYTSSFDSESSDASGKPGKSLEDRILWNKKMIQINRAKIESLKESLKNKRLPSNQLAHRAKLIKHHGDILQKATERLAHLMKQSPVPGRRQPSHLTKVNKNLHAKMEPNRIEVPAKSSAEGDIFNCADGDDTFNNADGDDFSGFDAKEMIKKNKNVLIGVGVAAAVIFGLHVAGVFKK